MFGTRCGAGEAARGTRVGPAWDSGFGWKDSRPGEGVNAAETRHDRLGVGHSPTPGGRRGATRDGRRTRRQHVRPARVGVSYRPSAPPSGALGQTHGAPCPGRRVAEWPPNPATPGRAQV